MDASYIDFKWIDYALVDWAIKEEKWIDVDEKKVERRCDALTLVDLSLNRTCEDSRYVVT